MDFHFHVVDDSNEHNIIGSGNDLTCKARMLLVDNFDFDDKIIRRRIEWVNAQPTTKCIIHGADKEDIFLFLLSATAYT
jgi:hypothetical protein